MTIDRSTRAKSQIADWNRDTEAYDPRPTLERVKVLVLALNGETDLHVASKLNLELIAAGLKTGGNKDVTTVFFPKLNHLFQTSQTGRLTEYGEIEERIALVVLETISNWIPKRARVKKQTPEN